MKLTAFVSVPLQILEAQLAFRAFLFYRLFLSVDVTMLCVMASDQFCRHLLDFSSCVASYNIFFPLVLNTYFHKPDLDATNP